MNIFKKITLGLGATFAISAAVLGLAIKVGALSCYQYNPNGFPTSSTPVFNNICGITSTLSSNQGSYPLGDEPNFVRIRPHASDNPLGADNPKLVNSLNSACNDGDKFDIWTYVHNDAEPQFNNNGTGSAVANNVKLALNAPLNKDMNSFAFSSSVSASNAAAVNDNTTLTCNGQPVKLTLVPNSVHYNNDIVNSTTFLSLPAGDSAINNTTPIGSPVWTAQKVWGCWNYRVVVVYTVKVQKQEAPKLTMVCKLSRFEIQDRTVKVTIAPEVQNVKVVGYDINWGDNSKHSNQVSDSHTYLGNGPFTVTAKFQVQLANGQKKWITSNDCTKTFRFANLTSTPKVLVNTGPGSMLGIFTVVSLAGAFLHRRWMLGRSQ